MTRGQTELRALQHQSNDRGIKHRPPALPTPSRRAASLFKVCFLSPGGFVFSLIVLEGFAQATQYFGGGFKHRFQPGARRPFRCLLSDGPEFPSELSAFSGYDGGGRDQLRLPCSTPLVPTGKGSKDTKARMVWRPAAYRYELAATVQVHLFCSAPRLAKIHWLLMCRMLPSGSLNQAALNSSAKASFSALLEGTRVRSGRPLL
jgi:hypothetical protein